MTKVIYLLTLIALSCGSTVSDNKKEFIQSNGVDTIFNFDKAEIDALPTEWIAATGTWAIAADGGNKAIKQVGNNNDGFNICVQNKLTYQNFEMEARIKAIEGKTDQGGGLVWRYLDSKNYYIMRVNPLENNFRLYKVVNGDRKQMESKNVQTKVGEWFAVKVLMNGATMDCYYNGQKLLSHSDDTFPNGGLVGFWSKADAVSLFDDLKIKGL